MREKKILVAPLNWGLGHAARCVPLICHLLDEGHEVCLASDGDAGIFLRRQFPEVPYLELPGYRVTYPRSGFYVHWIKQLPRLSRAMAAEKDHVLKHSLNWMPDVVISDNRYGVFLTGALNIIISHQLVIDLVPPLNRVVGNYLKTRIQRFDQCWIPDFDSDDNLSGKLSQATLSIPKYFIGPLSRFVRQDKRLDKAFDICVALSGPEPSRSILEEQLMRFFSNEGAIYKVAFVLGKPAESKSKDQKYSVFNHLSSRDLYQLFVQSDIVVSRSGYSSIMDYYRLNKKAILIPTPRQPEQEYLARRHALKKEFYVPKPDLSDLKRGIEILAGIEADLPILPTNRFPGL